MNAVETVTAAKLKPGDFATVQDAEDYVVSELARLGYQDDFCISMKLCFAARILRRSQQVLRRWCRAGTFPAFQPYGETSPWMVSIVNLSKWLAGEPVKQPLTLAQMAVENARARETG